MASSIISTPSGAVLYPWPRGMRCPTRADIESLIEGLISFLDEQDGDADLEPSLGSLDATTHSDFADQEEWAAGAGHDREAGDDNGIADADGMDWVTRRAA